MQKVFLIAAIFTVLLGGCAPAVSSPQAQVTATQAAAVTAPSPVEQTQAPDAAAEPTAAVELAPVSGTQQISRAITSEPGSLDPQGVVGSGQNVLLPYLFDTLVYRDIDNSYQPYLAEKWDTAPDGKQLTFTLRENVKFHDGTPLDAEAVKFTFDRLIEQGQKSVLASAVSVIDTIEVVDPRTIRFHFKEPSSTFIGSLSLPYAGIVSPSAVQAEGEAFGQKPVGTGAFMFEKWEPGVAITLVKNPDYAWGPSTVKNQGAPALDRLVFKIIPDAAQQVAAFQAGEIDMIFINQPSHLKTLQSDPNAEVVDTTLNSIVYLGFNVKKPPFDDVRVRQALSHAVNKQEIVDIALGGIGQPIFAPIAPTLPGYDASLKSYELGFDLDKAKSLLAEAGFEQAADGSWTKDGQALTFAILTSTRPPNQAIATVLQSQMKALGITVEINTLDSTAAQEAATQGNYDVMLWRYDWNDADVLRIYLSSSRIGRTNRNFYSNPEVDQLLEQAAHEMDEAARNQLYSQAQQLILQDAVWQPLYTPKDYMAIRKDVTGVVMGSMGRVLLNDAVKK